MIAVAPDKTIYDINLKNEKIIFFSYKKFLKDICRGKNCFICGLPPEIDNFNNEHVFPDWLLKRFTLSSSKINLPSSGTTIYGGYTLKCCKECNKKMGEMIEKPISKILKDYNSVSNYVKKSGGRSIYLWLALIFIKIHLKDREYKAVKGKNRGTIISKAYDWNDMHHIHCLARSFYTKCKISNNVFGSMLILPAKVNKQFPESFDFCSNLRGNGIMLRMNNVCIIAIFNDSGYANSIFYNQIKKIDSDLSPIQLREIFSRLIHINLALKKRPEYYTKLQKGKINIIAKIPQNNCFIKNYKPTVGDLMHYYCGSIVGGVKKDEILDNIKRGTYTFLFNEKGTFIN